MYKQFSLLLLLLLSFTVSISGQQVALKTNVLFMATASPNAGVEIGIGKKFSVDIWGAYNPWKFNNKMHLNFYLAQPEVLYWFCRKFEGHFIGLHGHYGHFDIGQIGRHWGLEATIGGGYARMEYTRYKCAECAEPTGYYTRSYIGPTRAGLSIIYFLR